MARNRQIYNVWGAFVSPTPATGFMFSSGNSGENRIQQLQRVQSVNHQFGIERTDVNVYGQLDAIDRVILNQPTVNATISWLTADFSNERKVGLYTSGNVTAIRDILNKTQDEKNYFLAVAPEGVDYYNYTGQSKTYSFLNAFITNYTAEGSVGNFPTVTLDLEALNWASQTGSFNQPLLAVDPSNGQVVAGRNFSLPMGVTGTAGSPSVILPGNISVSIGSAAMGLDLSNIPIQSYQISVPLARENLQKLGAKFAYTKEPTFPINATISVTANLTDLSEGNLADVLCSDNPYTITVNLRGNTCSGQGALLAQYIASGAKYDGEQFSTAIGSNGQVSINYTVPIGGPSSFNGIFMSGVS